MVRIYNYMQCFIQITDDELSFGEGQCQTKQGGFICKQCGGYINHPTTLLTHYKNEHDECFIR